MKKNFYYPIMAFSMLAAVSCGGEKKLGAGIDPSNMDKTAKPGTDFYQYACGGWIEKNPLTAEYSRFGTFDKLAEDNIKQIQDLIEDIASKEQQPGTVAQKINTLYNLAMDSVKLNNEKAEPIKEDLQRIAEVTDKAQLPALIADMQQMGIDLFFVTYVGADEKNSNNNLLQTYQSGISLGQKEYYLDKDSVTENIRNSYKTLVNNMFQLAGYDQTVSQKKMEDVLKIETAIAEGSLTATELRDPYANYNKMSYDEAKKKFAGFDWDAYMKELGVTVSEINISQPKHMEAVMNIFKNSSLDELKSYLEWKLLDSSASYLSDDFYNESFNFYGKVLSGKQEASPRWKRSVKVVNSTLSEAVGQMYVEKYFPPQAKERMVELVKNLQISLGQRIDVQEWMSDETKKKAHEKLDAFYVKVGYPDKWRDYTNLDIKNDSYWANIKRSNQFEYAYMYSKVGKPVDKTEWHMSPQTVNAYYNPTTNEICFPAAILQYPFFDMNADDAFNYGAIGVVIGHEMTHGFDDQGSLYDKDGNLNNWWTAEDSERFKAQTKVMEDYFNKIEVLPGLMANGKLTLGENIADHGGLKISFQAYKNATKNAPLETIDGFTPDQRFFIAYSTLWAGNVRDEFIRLVTKSDPHSLGRWRVNGALPHIDAWYEAFGITENDPMYLPKENRANVW